MDNSYVSFQLCCGRVSHLGVSPERQVYLGVSNLESLPARVVVGVSFTPKRHVLTLFVCHIAMDVWPFNDPWGRSQLSSCCHSGNHHSSSGLFGLASAQNSWRSVFWERATLPFRCGEAGLMGRNLMPWSINHCWTDTAKNS